MSTRGIDTLFRPSSIAIVGASSDPEKIGGRPLAYLNQCGYEGKIFPINPNHSRIMSLPCYGDLRQVPGSVEMAVVAVPPAKVLDALRSAAGIGVKAAVVLTAGFAEMNEEGLAMQRQIEKIALDSSMRVLGPNCLGLFSQPDKMVATFARGMSGGFPPSGPVALVTQSGAFGSHVFTLAKETNVPIDYWIATGNEADVDVADCIGYFAQCDGIRVIACYLEGCRDGAKLSLALRQAFDAGKYVVVLKAGQTDVGQRAISTHTAAMVGRDEAFSALFQQEGAFRVFSIQEFIDLVDTLSRLERLPQGRRVAVMTVSGGVGIVMADHLRLANMELPAPRPETQRTMQRLLPFAAIGNPIDVTAQVTNRPALFGQFMEALSGENYNQILVFYATRGLEGELDTIIGPLDVFRSGNPDCQVLVSTLTRPETRRMFHDAQITVLEEPMRAVQVACDLAEFAELRSNVGPRMDPSPLELQLPDALVLGEKDVAELLGPLGVDWVPHRWVQSAEEAAENASTIGYPVVLKGDVAGVIHKSDEGLVSVGLTNDDQIIGAYRKMQQRCQTAGKVLNGALVEAQIDGYEMLVGIERDKLFGPLVSVGVGGLYVEVIKDIQTGLGCLRASDVERMLRRLRLFPVLRGIRGKSPADIRAFSDLVAKVSEVFAASPRMESLELNPVFVREAGRGAVVADAVLTLTQQ